MLFINNEDNIVLNREFKYRYLLLSKELY